MIYVRLIVEKSDFMKKLEKYIYIIIAFILGVALISGTVFMVMNKEDKQEIKKEENNGNKKEDKENNNEKKEDGIEYIGTNKNNDSITESFKIVLNGKELPLNIKYTFDKESLTLIGRTVNKTLYSMSYNECDEDCQKEEFSTTNINKIFNKNNLMIIKGKDKNYLGMITNENNAVQNLLILNDELEVINEEFNYLGGEAKGIEEKREC